MNTRKVIISAVLIASLSMLAFAQQQRQAGNAQGAAKGTPQMQAQLQQQDAECPMVASSQRTPPARKAALEPTTRLMLQKVHHCKCNNNCVTLVRMSRHNPFF